MEALKRFDRYIFGHSITIFTDHGALSWLLVGRPALKGKLYSWSIFLSLYQLKIVYVKGSTNLDTNFLSRRPCASEVEQLVNTNFEIYPFGRNDSSLLLEDPLVLKLLIQMSELTTRELQNINIPLVKNSAQALRLHDAQVRLTVKEAAPIKRVRFDLSHEQAARLTDGEYGNFAEYIAITKHLNDKVTQVTDHEQRASHEESDDLTEADQRDFVFNDYQSVNSQSA